MKKKTKLPLAELKKQLEFHKNGIAAHRDALRDLQCEIDDILDPSNDAVEALESAIDRISEVM